MIVFLVPAGRRSVRALFGGARGSGTPPGQEDGRFRRWAHAASVQWQQLVEGGAASPAARPVRRAGAMRSSAAWPRRSPSSARSGRCGRATDATLSYPATIAVERARSELDKALSHARAASRAVVHHRSRPVRVLGACSSSFLARTSSRTTSPSALIGHLQSWRGARQAMDVVKWTFEPDAGSGGARIAGRCAARGTGAARRRDCGAAEPAAAAGVFRSRRRPFRLKAFRFQI